MIALACAIAVTAICFFSLVYSARLLRFFKGGVLSVAWVGVFFASFFLLVCSIATVLDVVNGEEDFMEIGANLGISAALLYAGLRSQRFWTTKLKVH